MYVSATAASEVKDLAYMVRLGMWGRGTPFKDFSAFEGEIEKAGTGAMELLAMDMKRCVHACGQSSRSHQARRMRRLAGGQISSQSLASCAEVEPAASALPLTRL